MPRVIKRYGNRKLYDLDSSTYVTLHEIAEMVKAGEDIQVIDNRTKEDLTEVTLTQIILEEEKQKRPILPLSVLKDLIKQGSDSITHAVERGRDQINTAREDVEKIFRTVIEKGEATRDETEKAIRDVISRPAKSIEGIQKRVDETVRQAVEAVTQFRKMRDHVVGLETKISELEKKLAEREADEPQGPHDPGSAI
ncbi:MAG: polyhydroxyalkanoate synthesis regulator DNA-binding domain-containing protein [Myxococcales bacterium]|nr:polyhydroxyalkanoate synthesis regulator DNA-binding domain-containing protein [Myxococcales bacterium]